MRKEALFKLAEENKLPLYQFIDTETILWIKKNKPKFGNVKKVYLPKREVLERFVPSCRWFFEKKVIHSIHGLRHILRVAINTLFIVSRREEEKILTAAALHDIGRKNDKGDSGHSLRAARWFKKNVAMIGKKFEVRFQERDVEEIYWSIFFHELPRTDFEKDKHYLNFKKSVDTIRIADVLDRYRLPKVKWWINENILGVPIATELKKNAFNLVVKSEQNFLAGQNSRDSVLDILE